MSVQATGLPIKRHPRVAQGIAEVPGYAEGIGPSFSGSQPLALPLGYAHHRGFNLIHPQGSDCQGNRWPHHAWPIYPARLQAGTTSEPLRGIEPLQAVYKTAALPLCDSGVESGTGIEPASPAWKAEAQPLCHPDIQDFRSHPHG
jgi:hypothetical protein